MEQRKGMSREFPYLVIWGNLTLSVMEIGGQNGHTLIKGKEAIRGTYCLSSEILSHSICLSNSPF